MSYESDYQELLAQNKKSGDFAVSYLFEMADQPFAVKDGYAVKKDIYFRIIRQHPKATKFNRLSVDTYEGDQMRRTKRYTEAEDLFIGLVIPQSTPVDIRASVLQAWGQLYYHTERLDQAFKLQIELINLRRFGKLPAGKQLLAFESLFTTLLKMGKTEEAVKVLQRKFSFLVTASLENHEVQRAFGGLIHVWADLESARQRYMMAANLFYILHITPEPDPRNQVVAAIKFLQCLDLAGANDDGRAESVGQYFKANHHLLEPGDKIGLADAWKFACRKFGIAE